jgi:AcrR family transcriptional regulator
VDARIALMARLRARQAEIERVIFARVRGDRFERTGAEDREYIEGLRVAGEAGLEYVLTGVELWGRSLAPVPPAVLAQARRAARAGVGLDTVLRRYVAGHAVVEDFVACEVECEDREDLPLEVGALRSVLAAIAALVDRLIRVVSGAYSREAELLAAASREPVVSRAVVSRAHRRDRVREGEPEGAGVRAPIPCGRRERIVAAMVEVVAERGFAHTTVRLVSERAGISTRTFYEEFESLPECFLAVLDYGLERARELIVETLTREAGWRDGIRSTLLALLVGLDAAPQLTRVWFVEALAAGSWALEHRERNLAQARSIVIEHLAAPGLGGSDSWILAGVMSSILGLIHTHLVTSEGPLLELLGPLTGLVTVPFLDFSEVEAEVARAERLAEAIKRADGSGRVGPVDAVPSGQRAIGSPVPPSPGSPAPSLQGSPAPPVPGTRRGRECLLYLADHPGASNSEIAAAIGIAHRSQISKLLSSLSLEGLVAKLPRERSGTPNAWLLTPAGETTLRALDTDDVD